MNKELNKETIDNSSLNNKIKANKQLSDNIYRTDGNKHFMIFYSLNII